MSVDPGPRWICGQVDSSSNPHSALSDQKDPCSEYEAAHSCCHHWLQCMHLAFESQESLVVVPPRAASSMHADFIDHLDPILIARIEAAPYHLHAS